ncbi:MAG TPA: ribonuclease P protein component [Thermomonas sp.]|jgi:ribonuclease P protein component|nr:ribonuclease P protein component [Pseudomonadota bacterium]MDE2382271.1 ribonuclease P protein component [Xanthomonadaceae bacterium]HQA00990.1 ribonuclease P protein component [Thermomonas sp.]HQQ57922.1 ribonuclease P protein component [Thermomonas sp.]
MTQDALNLTPVSTQDAGVIAFAGSCGLPPQARVRAKAEFTQVFETGKRVAEPLMALHWLHDTHAPRIGLAVSRKVDPNAVGRNRIKRVLRDAFRHLRPQLRPGAYVIVARAAARQADNVALRDCFDRLLKRACALPQIQARGTMPPAPSLPQDASAPIMAVEPGKPVQ